MAAPLHVSTSTGFAWMPVISADGRYLAGNGANTVYLLDPAAQGNTGPLLFDLQAGKITALGLAQDALAVVPSPRVLGVGANGADILFQGGFYSAATAPYDSPFDGYYVEKADGSPAVPLSRHPNGKLKLAPEEATLSADGAHVVVHGREFDAAGNHVANGVFEVDLRTGAVAIVTLTSEGIGMIPQRFMGGVGTSADGGVVAFNTVRFDPVTDAAIHETQAWNVATKKMTLANTATDGTLADVFSVTTAVSGNGRYVAFDSKATNLVAGAANGHSRVYVKDLATGAIRIASTDAAGYDLDQASVNPIRQAISDDGRYVLMVAPDDRGHTRVFVKDMQTGDLARIDTTPEIAGLDVRGAAISGNGQTIVFQGVKAGVDDAPTHSEIQTWTLPLPTFGQRAVAGTLKGSSGADTLAGGLGDDTYYVDHGKDIVIEYAGGGTDTVHATLSYALPDNVENLTLDGVAPIHGTGNALANTLTGNGAANHLLGGAGDDLIAGGGGEDTIDGGAGTDTVRFDGKLAAWRIAGGDHHLVAQRAGGGVVLYTSVELLQFDDAMVTFDTAGANGQVYRLYQAAFDRAPDAGGMGFWMRQAQKGTSLAGIADEFVRSAEFKAVFGEQPANAHLVDGLYRHVLHRAPDAGGAAYWLDLLDRHVLDASDVLAAFSESPENVAALTGVLEDGIAYVPYGV